MLLVVALLGGCIAYDDQDETGQTAIVRDGCFVGGCSSQVCSDDPHAATDCQYKAEYACYEAATCERQVGGACGWTETDALAACIAAARN